MVNFTNFVFRAQVDVKLDLKQLAQVADGQFSTVKLYEKKTKDVDTKKQTHHSGVVCF